MNNIDAIYTVCKEFTYREALASNDHAVRLQGLRGPECWRSRREHISRRAPEGPVVSDKYVLKCVKDYVSDVEWGRDFGLTCFHTGSNRYALKLSFSEAHDLRDLIFNHQVPNDCTFEYRIVKLKGRK